MRRLSYIPHTQTRPTALRDDPTVQVVLPGYKTLKMASGFTRRRRGKSQPLAMLGVLVLGLALVYGLLHIAGTNRSSIIAGRWVSEMSRKPAIQQILRKTESALREITRQKNQILAKAGWNKFRNESRHQ